MIDRRLRNVRGRDLAFVLLDGLALPFAFGIVAGFADYYLATLSSFSLGAMFYWLIALYTGGVLRRQYEEPHLVYAVVATAGLLLSAVVIYTVPYVYAEAVLSGGSPLAVFNPASYIRYAAILFNPLNWILHFSFGQTLWIVSIGVATYLGVRKAVQRSY